MVLLSGPERVCNPTFHAGAVWLIYLGIGLSAKSVEKGGSDLIIIYNSGRFRMAGRGSLAGLMPYGDANQIVLEMVCILCLLPKTRWKKKPKKNKTDLSLVLKLGQ